MKKNPYIINDFGVVDIHDLAIMLCNVGGYAIGLLMKYEGKTKKQALEMVKKEMLNG